MKQVYFQLECTCILKGRKEAKLLLTKYLELPKEKDLQLICLCGFDATMYWLRKLFVVREGLLAEYCLTRLFNIYFSNFYMHSLEFLRPF
jgi:hypothetical protein